MDARFLLQRGDRAYVVYDDSDTIFNEGSSPVGVPLKYIGLLQGSKTSGNWDLLWLYFGSNKPYGIVTRLRNNKWSSYTSWFPIPLKDCNLPVVGQWSKLALVSNVENQAVYQAQLTNEESLVRPSSILELIPSHSENASFLLSFYTTGAGCQDILPMSSLIAAHGGSPA